MEERNDTLRIRLTSILLFLVEPPGITDIEQKRQVRLLASVLLVIILLGSGSAVIQLLTIPGFAPTFLVLAAAIAIMVVAYAFTRMRWYVLAATITSITPSLASFIAVLTDPQDQSTFGFLLISVVLSSVLLNRWYTAGIAVLNMVGLLVLPLLQPTWTYAILSGIISYHILIPVLIIVAMRYRDLTERDRQKELHKSEERFREMADNIHEVFYLADLTGPSLLYVNPAYETIWGRTRQSLYDDPRSFLEAVHPEDSQRVLAYQARQRQTDGAQEEYRILQPDGAVRWVWDRAFPLRGAQGQVDRMCGVVQDITERKHTEEQLRRSEERYRSLFENNPQPMWVYDLETLAFLAVNDAAIENYGYSREEFLQLTLRDIRPAEDVPRLLDNIAHLAGGIDRAGYWRHITKAGTMLDVEITSHTLLFEGRPAELVLVNDVTERKRIEDALRENEAIFSSFLEHSPVYVFFKDKEIRSLRLSRNYEQMLGMPLEDLLGKSMYDLFPSDLAKRMVEDDMRILNEGQRIDVTEEFNGRIYETTKFPVLKDGQPHLLAGFTLDVTERKRAEQKLQLSEERYRTLAQNLPDSALLLFDLDLRFIIADGPEIGPAGFSREMLEGKKLHEALPPEFGQTLEPSMRRALGGEKFYAEVPYEDRFYRHSYVPIRDSSGEVSLAMILVTNITKRKRMQEILFEEKERAEITLQSIGDAVITTDTEGRVEYLNPIAENLTGWKLEEAVGKPIDSVFRVIAEGSRQPATSPVERCLQEGKVVGLVNHSLLIRRDGREFAIDDSAAPIRNRRGELIGVVLVFHDVTEQRRLSRQVAHDAMHDSLTGLVNRREFEKRLARALVNTKEHGVSHILCYLDLDQFKIVNDTAGHAAGDELLKQISGLLAGLFRQRDTFARLGGDEFGLLLENCQLDQAVVISGEIIAKIRNFPFVWAGNSFQVGASIGIVPITAVTESITQLLSQADIACYSAKDLGRGRMYIYQRGDSETTQRHNEIMQAARMRDAVVNDQFRLYCQPIAPLSGEPSEVRHYEILLRMASGSERLVLPSTFIPSAERYGLMPAIDRWVIRETFMTLSKHDIEGMQIAINLSGNSLDDETLLDYVLEQLQEFAIPPERICFEITETAAIHHLSKAQRFIQAFRERNGKIALDDFGSGFSSFRYLKSLPVDFIKIDGSFVSDMLSNQADYAMVQAMTEIAHTLGIEIIAEHALDSETIKCLSEIGAEYAQGFGIGSPIPFESAWET